MTERVKEKLKKAVLEKYKEVGRIDAACLQVGLNRMTFYSWLRKDPNFKSAYAYIIKRKLMKDRHGIEIREV